MVVDNYMKLNPPTEVVLFVNDYAFGWSVEEIHAQAGQPLGIEFVGADRMPLGTREYSGFVSKAAAAKPDVLCLLNAGQDVLLSIREAHNFGLAPKVTILNSWGVGTEDFLQLDPKTRENLWVGTNAYYGANTPVAKKMAETYQAKYNAPPGYAPCAAYGMTRLTLRAIEKANSAEPADIVKALEGWDNADWPDRVWVNEDPPDRARLLPAPLQEARPDEAPVRLRRHRRRQRPAGDARQPQPGLQRISEGCSRATAVVNASLVAGAVLNGLAVTGMLYALMGVGLSLILGLWPFRTSPRR
jgi:hypothetical protein